jgi:hypothetical protein
MKNLKELMNNKVLQSKKTKPSRKVEQWQDYAAEVIKNFNIENRRIGIIDKNGKFQIQITNYKAMIFRYAKNNMPYLIGKVESCYEKFGKEEVKNKSNYLISLFRKKKPWNK